MDPRELRVVGTQSCRYCALSGLGGRDIAGGVCFKNPTGGDFRFFVIYTGTTEYDTVVYRPANKKQLLRVSLRFLFVGPTSGHFPIISDFTERLNRVLFVRAFRTSINFLVGDGYSERVPPTSNAPRCGVLAAETKTAASSQQQPTTKACRMLPFRCFYHTKGKKEHKVVNPHICVYFIHHPIRTYLVHFLVQLGLHVALALPFIFWIVKTSSLS